jgi:ABC-type glycerol-3-phosphate transport system substrate-binding protein
MSRLRVSLLALATGIAALTALTTTASGATDKKYAVSGKLSFVGIWSGPEQKNFQLVLNAFHAKYPGVSVKYTSGGDNTPTILATGIAGGNPPDLAAVGQPGLVKQFSGRKAIKPIDFVKPVMTKNYAPSWVTLGTYSGHLYGMVFKGANKSTIWYSTTAFKNAGVKPPATWTALLAAAKTLRASGTPAYSIAGADGWTLTDLMENLYLRQAGAAKYDQLSTHKIKWTDPSVKATLKTMAEIFSDTGNIYGGTSGALQTDFPTSVNNVFSLPPKAAMVMEGDFVAGASTTKAKPVTDFNEFAFPSVNGSAPSVVGGGDTVVMFKDSPAARALVSYLATPAAATIWAKKGGFSSPNKGVPASAYTDSINRATATALAKAKIFRFDMSDLQPAAFGGTAGQGEWQILQDFLKTPTDIDGTASKLETAAAAAYKK